MNRVDRLLAMVLELQAKGCLRAEDLAKKFEISKRTVYRDIEALCEMGIPVIAQPGQGYSLMEGYFLPPLSFSTDEAMALLLGSDFITQIFDTQFSSAARAAAGKITAVLSDKHRREIDTLKAGMRLIALTGPDVQIKPETLRQLRQAIVGRKTIRFDYHSRSGDEPGRTQRDADPYELVHYDGQWYLLGYCHLRHDIRIFRLDRITYLKLLPATFTPLPDYQQRRIMNEQDLNLVVRVLFDHEVTPWVQEEHLYYIKSRQPVADGLLVTLHVRHENDIRQWLLGWGAHVRILEPESLRLKLLREAEGMLRNFKNSESLLP